MINNVVDTHRLMYRNARLRALDLSDRTSQLHFFNVTEDNTAGEDVGDIVYTNANGYLFYGNNAQAVSCLVVNKSAIIQVDLHGNNAWDIEWIVRVAYDNDFVRIDDIGRVYYFDGTEAWNPLSGYNWTLPDFIKRDEFRVAEWAEGEMIVNSDTPEVLNVDVWTHTIVIANTHADHYKFAYASGRSGQCIHIINNSQSAVIIQTEDDQGNVTGLTLYPTDLIVATFDIGVNNWILRGITGDVDMDGFGLRYQKIDNDNTEWLSSCRAKFNDRASFTHDPGTDRYLPPYTVALTASGNKIMYVMPSNGGSKSIAGLVSYDGDGVWQWTTNASVDPRYIQVISLDEDSFPNDSHFGSYNGTNITELTLPMVPGEELHVIIRIADRIDFAGGVSHNFKFKINHCTVFEGTSNVILKTDVLVSGTLKCCRWLDNSKFYTFKEDDAVGR